MERLAQILTVLVVGTLVGVEFGVAAFTNPVLEQLPDDAYRQARAAGSRILGAVMPFWYATAAALLVADAALAPVPLAIAALVLMAVVMVLSLTALVPINNRVAAWAGAGPDEAPTSRELAHRWDRLHWLRVAVLLGVFVLVALLG
ncbi:DUF1772 domain-containing protein [Mycolicibacterium sp. HS_4_1]